ncbi:hypothetical protein M9Y10_008062 [Tritrichomonas musculus]|uniref:Uncharacterized protein n=1 Tax=Tritrichomonas musculus TaxID=1915356 RepID=A0ABR2IXD3_9EUKA
MFFVIKPFLKFVGTQDSMILTLFKSSFIRAKLHLFFSQLYVLYTKVPLFLFVCKVPTMIMNQELFKIVIDIGFSFVLFVIIFAGKFSLKPTMKMFLSFKFSKCLLFPIPFTFAFATSFFPQRIILKALTDSAKQSGQSQSIGGVFAVYSQFSGLGSAIPSMLTTSLI